MKRGISGYLIASLLLHLIIGIILFVGLDFSKPKRPESKGQIVNAVMLDENFSTSRPSRSSSRSLSPSRKR